MTYKNFFLLLMMIAVVGFANAQVPGYLGKRLSINYNYSFFNQLNPSTRPDYHTMTNYNFKNNVSVDYIVSRKGAINVGFSSYKDKFSTVIKGYEYLYDNYSYTTRYIHPSGREADLSVENVDVNYKIYSGRSAAPIGNFFQFGLGLIRYTIKPYSNDGYGYFIENQYYPSDLAYSQLKAVNVGKVDMLSKDNGIGLNTSFTYGTEKVIYDLILLHISATVNLPMLGVPIWEVVKGLDHYENDEMNSSITTENYYHYLAQRRLYSRNIFYFNIGAGILIK